MSEASLLLLLTSVVPGLPLFRQPEGSLLSAASPRHLCAARCLAKAARQDRRRDLRHPRNRLRTLSQLDLKHDSAKMQEDSVQTAVLLEISLGWVFFNDQELV